MEPFFRDWGGHLVLLGQWADQVPNPRTPLTPEEKAFRKRKRKMAEASRRRNRR